jgi:predicted phosphoadenosine phosphosulfate sulfurtransferase
MLRDTIIKNRIKKYIKQWEGKGYSSGIPDEADLVLEGFLLVPSYRMICQTIFKNDFYLTGLGMEKPHCGLYSQIKRAELLSKGKIEKPIQLEFFNERV